MYVFNPLHMWQFIVVNCDMVSGWLWIQSNHARFVPAAAVWWVAKISWQSVVNCLYAQLSKWRSSQSDWKFRQLQWRFLCLSSLSFIYIFRSQVQIPVALLRITTLAKLGLCGSGRTLALALYCAEINNKFANKYILVYIFFPLVLWLCCFFNRKRIRPVKTDFENQKVFFLGDLTYPKYSGKRPVKLNRGVVVFSV